MRSGFGTRAASYRTSLPRSIATRVYVGVDQWRIPVTSAGLPFRLSSSSFDTGEGCTPADHSGSTAGISSEVVVFAAAIFGVVVMGVVVVEAVVAGVEALFFANAASFFATTMPASVPSL